MQIDVERFLSRLGVLPFGEGQWRAFKIFHYQTIELASADDLLNEIRDSIDRKQGGVYVYENSEGQCLYVGKAQKIRDRFRTHFERAYMPDHRGDRNNRHHNFWSTRTGELKVYWLPIERELDRQIIEIMLTEFLKPVFVKIPRARPRR